MTDADIRWWKRAAFTLLLLVFSPLMFYDACGPGGCDSRQLGIALGGTLVWAAGLFWLGRVL